jgi:hypothetical protein
MEYPLEFTSDQQAAVEEEKILATEEFWKSRLGIYTSEHNGRERLTGVIRKYIVRVMLVFAKQACVLGRIRTWDVAKVDFEVKEFLHQTAREAETEKTFFANGDYLRNVSFTYGRSMGAQEMHYISEMPEWKEYLKELREVAAIQKTPVAFDPTGFEDSPEKTLNEPESPTPNDEVARCLRLLEEYKSATDRPSNRSIYTAKNSGIHKPEFLRWQRGELPKTSATCQNFERFLAAKKRPIPRNTKP